MILHSSFEGRERMPSTPVPSSSDLASDKGLQEEIWNATVVSFSTPSDYAEKFEKPDFPASHRSVGNWVKKTATPS